MQLRHHVSTIYLIIMIIIVIASISIFSISKAIKLQTLSSSQRELVRKEIFLQEEEMWHSDSQDSIKDDLNELRSAKALLEQVDESINFNDLIYKPTKVLGFSANQNVIGSALGIIATLFREQKNGTGKWPKASLLGTSPGIMCLLISHSP